MRLKLHLKPIVGNRSVCEIEEGWVLQQEKKILVKDEAFLSYFWTDFVFNPGLNVILHSRHFITEMGQQDKKERTADLRTRKRIKLFLFPWEQYRFPTIQYRTKCAFSDFLCNISFSSLSYLPDSLHSEISLIFRILSMFPQLFISVDCHLKSPESCKI